MTQWALTALFIGLGIFCLWLLLRPARKRSRRWNGRHSQEYLEYINSSAWRRRREEYLATHPRCQMCGNPDVPLEVHHNNYDNLRQEEDGDLAALCKPCHTIADAQRRKRTQVHT